MSKKSTVFAVDFTTGASYTEETRTRGIERGALVSLVAQTGTPTARKGDCYIRLEILTGGESSEHVAIVLAEDYLTYLAPVSWNGLYPISPQSSIRLVAVSRAVTQIRVSGTINIEE